MLSRARWKAPDHKNSKQSANFVDRSFWLGRAAKFLHNFSPQRATNDTVAVAIMSSQHLFYVMTFYVAAVGGPVPNGVYPMFHIRGNERIPLYRTIHETVQRCNFMYLQRTPTRSTPYILGQRHQVLHLETTQYWSHVSPLSISCYRYDAIYDRTFQRFNELRRWNSKKRYGRRSFLRRSWCVSQEIRLSSQIDGRR